MSKDSIRTVSVGVLLPFEYNLYQIAIILDVLKSTNQYCSENGMDFQFEVEIVQTQGQINENSSAFYDFQVTNTLTEKSYELVFIPPLDSNDISEILDKNKVFKDWILDQYEEHAQIYSFSNAHVLLAYAGLLDEKKVSSSSLNEEFFNFFPIIQKGPFLSFQKINQIVLSEGSLQIFYTFRYILELLIAFVFNKIVLYTRFFRKFENLLPICLTRA